MARQARAQQTIVDINDGVNPVVAFATNENHTFSASETGVVSSVSGFSSEIMVFVGQTAATYEGTETSDFDGNNQFIITDISYTGTSTGWATPTNTNGTITIGSISQTAVDSVVLRVLVSVRNDRGTIVADVPVDITLSVTRNGAGGTIIELTSNGQAFRADAGGTTVDSDTTNPDIVFNIETQGTTGAISYNISQNGGAFSAVTATSTGVGGIAAYDTDTSGDVDTTGTLPTGQNAVSRLRITRANFGNNRTMALRISGDSGGQDTITVFRVDQGDDGEDSIIIAVTSNNGNIFRNAAGTAKTLTATVTDSGTGTTPTGTITYTWERSGSGSVSEGTVRVTSQSDRTVIASGGVLAENGDFPSIIVGAEDVDTEEAFTCIVDVAE